MKILDIINANERIEIISNNGKPTVLPADWGPVLGKSDLLVAIPDMHMYDYHSHLDHFKFGAEGMLDLLRFLQGVKTTFENEGKKLSLYQLGDLFELRFPSPKGNGTITGPEIKQSHPMYETIIKNLEALDTTLIYGNHDFEHREKVGFKQFGVEGA